MHMCICEQLTKDLEASFLNLRRSGLPLKLLIKTLQNAARAELNPLKIVVFAKNSL